MQTRQDWVQKILMPCSYLRALARQIGKDALTPNTHFIGLEGYPCCRTDRDE